MEEIKTWITGICAISLAIAIIKSLLPETAAGKTFDIIAALLMVVAIVSPIKEIDLSSFRVDIDKGNELLAEKVDEVKEKNAEMIDDIISDKLCEYICNKTGITREDISVICENGEIRKVILYKNNQNAREILKNECGIPLEKIQQEQRNA